MGLFVAAGSRIITGGFVALKFVSVAHVSKLLVNSIRPVMPVDTLRLKVNPFVNEKRFVLAEKFSLKAFVE
jgi:hypothetical protein